jgi:hypothetical protein
MTRFTALFFATGTLYAGFGMAAPIIFQGSGRVAMEKSAEEPEKYPRYPEAPKYGIEEFVYVTEEGKERPLILAPKIALNFITDPAFKDDQRMPNLKVFANKHNGDLVKSLGEATSRADAAIRLDPDLDQAAILQKINMIAQEASGIYDVAPVFLVPETGREAIVSGIDIELASAVSTKTLLDMLRNYGDITDEFSVKDIGEGTGYRWHIAPEKSLFAIGKLRKLMSKDDRPRTKFQLHLLLLANQLRAQERFQGVKILAARPTFLFLDPPLSATLHVEWPSATIDQRRELHLVITVTDTKHVVFKPKDLPHFGRGDFRPKNKGLVPIEDLLHYVGAGDEWEDATAKNPTITTNGGREVAVYSFVKSFYLLQPEEEWQFTTPVQVPFTLLKWDAATKKMLGTPMQADATSTPFWVLAHHFKDNDEGIVQMPLPRSYSIPKDVRELVAPPQAVAPEANTHPFASVLAWADKHEMGSAIRYFPAAGGLIGFALLGLARAMYRKDAMRRRSLRPAGVPFMTREALERRAAALPADAPNAMLVASLEVLRDLCVSLLVERIPEFTPGKFTVPHLKSAHRVYADPEISQRAKEALAEAVRLIESAFGDLNRDESDLGVMPQAILAQKCALARDGVLELHRQLSELPARMQIPGDRGASHGAPG